MKTLKILLCLAGVLIAVSITGNAFPGTDSTQLPPPGMHRMGLSGIAGDQQYLYVMAGGKILEYDQADMSLIKTVALPDPGPPPAPPADTTGKSDLHKFPPPPAGPHGLWASDHFLYVLAGPKLYRYSTPDLTLQLTTELPKPDPPTGTK